MTLPDPNEWVVATHKWCTHSDGTPKTMKCQYVAYSNGSGGFFNGNDNDVWNPGEVSIWEPMATGEK